MGQPESLRARDYCCGCGYYDTVVIVPVVVMIFVTVVVMFVVIFVMMFVVVFVVMFVVVFVVIFVVIIAVVVVGIRKNRGEKNETVLYKQRYQTVVKDRHTNND